MKANELRIGNIISQGFYGPEPVKAYSIYQYYLLENGNTGVADYYKEWKPIPITEEWLRNIGFDNWGSNQVNEFEIEHVYCCHNIVDGTSDFKVIRIDSNYDNQMFIQWIIRIDHDTIYVKDLEFLHQVQNICFDLCGYELTLKELV